MEKIALSDRMNTAQAAQYLGVSVSTLAVWRYEKRNTLPYVKIGSRVFYPRDGLNEWLKNRSAQA